MKKLLSQATVGLLVGGAILSAVAGGPEAPPMVTPGLYLGLGGGYNSFYVARSLNATQVTAAGAAVTASIDSSDDTNSKFAPLAQLGYWAPIDSEWLWGLQATYKYLNYTTNGVYNGQALVASNTATPAYFERTSVNNELLLLAYAGMQFEKGYAYLGLGASMFTVRDFFGPVAGGAAANYFGLNTFVNYMSANRTQWGGAMQVGYNYYFKPTWFVSTAYTFAMTGTYSSTQSKQSLVHTGVANFRVHTVSHDVQLEIQEVTFSINKVFEL